MIAANRDELHARPTIDAGFWPDAPDVIGGRDVVSGGSWLAVARGGRWAAVTNLRAARPKQKSRGALVRDFVLSDIAPAEYARNVNADAAAYAGFHLLIGDVGGSLFYVTPDAHVELPPGIHAYSNAARGEHWPKTVVAKDSIEALLAAGDLDPDRLVEALLRFLRTPRGTGSPMTEVFVSGEEYGTRASTVIIASRDSIIVAEQTFGPGGAPRDTMRYLHFAR